MIDKLHLARVKLVNQLPLNRVAVRFLAGPPLQSEAAVLTLMRWGLDNGIEIPQLAPGYPTAESLMQQITSMTTWEPHRVLPFLVDPEEHDDGTVLFTAEDLAAAEGPMEAAAILLENLYYAMMATGS